MRQEYVDEIISHADPALDLKYVEMLAEQPGFDRSHKKRRVVLNELSDDGLNLESDEFHWLEPLGRDHKGQKIFGAAVRGHGSAKPMYICQSSCVLLRAPDSPRTFYIAKAVKLYERPSDGAKMISCQWFYRAEETVLANRKGSANRVGKREVFISDYVDENDLHVVEDICEVLAESFCNNLLAWLDDDQSKGEFYQFYYGSKYVPAMKCFKALDEEDIRTAKTSFAASVRAIERTIALRSLKHLTCVSLLPSAEGPPPVSVRLSFRFMSNVKEQNYEKWVMHNKAKICSEWKAVIRGDIYSQLASNFVSPSNRVGYLKTSPLCVDDDVPSSGHSESPVQNISNPVGTNDYTATASEDSISWGSSAINLSCMRVFASMIASKPEDLEPCSKCSVGGKQDYSRGGFVIEENVSLGMVTPPPKNVKPSQQFHGSRSPFELASKLHPDDTKTIHAFTTPSRKSVLRTGTISESPTTPCPSLESNPTMPIASTKIFSERAIYPCAQNSPSLSEISSPAINPLIARKFQLFNTQHSRISWIGLGERRCDGCIHYSAARLESGEEVSLGCCVKVLARQKEFSLARITEMWESHGDSYKMMRCEWFCTSDEVFLEGQKEKFENCREVFQDEAGFDDNYLSSIVCRTIVLHKSWLPAHFNFDLLQDEDIHFFTRSYSRQKRQIRETQPVSMCTAIQQDISTVTLRHLKALSHRDHVDCDTQFESHADCSSLQQRNRKKSI